MEESLKWKIKVEKLEAQRIKEIEEMKNNLEQYRNLHIGPNTTVSEAERTAYST